MFSRRALQLKVGDAVVRGPDWDVDVDRGDQDGGDGKTGIVVRQKGYDEGMYYVRWDASGYDSHSYAAGFRGYVDLLVVDAKEVVPFL